MSSTWALPRIALPPSLVPRASVVILGWKNPALLAKCLASLSRHLPDGVAEVVLLLNGATADVRTYVQEKVSGVRVLFSEVNLGFAGGCNRAVRDARGEFVVLLNDDAEIEPQWLERLIETADEFPAAGAVGSLILSADGIVQEAGCVIGKDGVVAQVGQGTTLWATPYVYRRRVDYCSGCSILVRRDVWDELGGMDEDYYPAYYEDVDFCLKVRAAGREVVFEPRSRIRHVGSASTEALFRAFLGARNHRKFVGKWKAHLTTPESFPLTSDAAIRRAVFKARGFDKHVLVIDRAVPDGAEANTVRRLLERLSQAAAVSFTASSTPPQDSMVLGPLGIETLPAPLEPHLAQPERTYDSVVIVRSDDQARHADVLRRLQPCALAVHVPEALLERAPDAWISTVQSLALPSIPVPATGTQARTADIRN